MDEHKRRFLVSFAVAAIFLIFFVGSANAGCIGESDTDYGCGDTVTESCTFDENLKCPAGHGLTVGANGITIDGAGFKITGSETADACEWVGEISPGTGYCGIFNKGYDNVVIKNLEIENFCTGIGLQGSGANPVASNTIDNCEIHDNGNASCSTDTSIHGVHACYVSECTISNNRIYNNTGTGAGCGDGGNGIFLYAGSEAFTNNTVIQNEIYDNRKGGFLTKKKLHHARITGNHVYGNGQGGIILRCMMARYNIIEGNNASCNYGDGIFIGSQYNTIRNNVVRNNIAGFRIKPHDAIGYGDGINMGRNRESNNNELISNEVCGNEGVDINVEPDCSGNHGRDNTCDRTKNYADDGTAGCSNACPEELNAGELAKELKEQGWVLYGTNRCPWCVKQKGEFGDAFMHVDYVNCDENRQACTDANITSIPCWVSPDGALHSGYHDLTRLSELASAYRVEEQPTATSVATPATPGFESVFAVIALIVITLSFFFKERTCAKKENKGR